MNAIIGYIPTLPLAFGYVWISGLREPLAKSAYRDIFVNYSMMFLSICIIYNIIDIARKRKVKASKLKAE